MASNAKFVGRGAIHAALHQPRPDQPAFPDEVMYPECWENDSCWRNVGRLLGVPVFYRGSRWSVPTQFLTASTL